MTTTPPVGGLGTQPSQSQMGKQRSMRDIFREGSPDEIRERMKETVAKGVAAFAGAMRGFSEEAKRNELPQQTKDSIHEAGETARSAISSTTEEVKGLREPVKQAGQTLGETARDIGQSAKQEARNTRDSMRGGGSSGGGSPLDSSVQRGVDQGVREGTRQGLREGYESR